MSPTSKVYGPISIMGTPEPRKVLMVRTNGAVPFSELEQGSEKFQWLRDGQPIEGETLRTYTVSPDDVECALTVAYFFKVNGEEDQIISKPEKVDMGFWRNLYWKELGREPDAAGLRFWKAVVKEQFREGIK